MLAVCENGLRAAKAQAKRKLTSTTPIRELHLVYSLNEDGKPVVGEPRVELHKNDDSQSEIIVLEEGDTCAVKQAVVVVNATDQDKPCSSKLLKDVTSAAPITVSSVPITTELTKPERNQYEKRPVALCGSVTGEKSKSLGVRIMSPTHYVPTENIAAAASTRPMSPIRRPGSPSRQQTYALRQAAQSSDTRPESADKCRPKTGGPRKLGIAGMRSRAATSLAGRMTPIDDDEMMYRSYKHGLKATQTPNYRASHEPAYEVRDSAMNTSPIPGPSTPVNENYRDYYQQIPVNEGEWMFHKIGQSSRPPTPLLQRRSKQMAGLLVPGNHSGRMGSSWRHIKQCTGNLGNQIMFIDGSIKYDDGRRFPPWAFSMEPESGFYRNDAYHNTLNGLKRDYRVNKYQDAAKNGHRYWYEDKRPWASPVHPKMTIQGRAMRYGTGY